MSGLALRWALGVLLTAPLALAGCASTADAGSRWPAAAAGPACQLIEYDVVAARLGTVFDTAGGARKGETLTCALTRAGHDFPYLTLAMTPSTADDVIFRVTVMPSGSTAVENLGRIAYRLNLDPSDDRGPAVEIGWLAHDARMLILRYTCAPDTPAAEVKALNDTLLALARQIDQGPAVG